MRKLLIILPLIGVLLPAPPSSARSFDPPQINRVYFAALKHEIAAKRIIVAPSPETGYGKLVVTGLTLIKGSRITYRASVKVYDERRTVMGASRTMLAADWCMPWDSGTIFGCSSPFDPGSWNWDSLWKKLNKKIADTNPLKPVTYDNQKKCASGAFKAATLSTVSKTGIGYLVGMKDYVRVTPQGYALGIIAGCAISLWW